VPVGRPAPATRPPPTLRQAADEATAARDEVITELDTRDATLAATQGELEQVCTEAAEQISVVEQRATEQIRPVSIRASGD
jgi:hypothetical protein